MSQPSLHILRDRAVAAHASSARPAWLFSCDGSRLLFANAAGAKMLGIEANEDATDFAVPRELATRIARSAATLRTDGQPRLERLRGLGTHFGQPPTCTCTRIDSTAGPALLVAATEPAGPAPTLCERARYLLEGQSVAAAFGADGALVYVTPGASPLIGKSTSLHDLGDGIETLRLGSDADTLVLAFFPANSQPITRPDDTVATAQPEFLDLSPIAEAITAMTKVPPHRNGHDGVSLESTPASAASSATGSDHPERRYPLRFFWETDAENRFTISTEAFLTLAGPRTRNLLGRFWGEISAKLALDPDGLVSQALVSRETWSGIEVNWPVSGQSITITLSAIPVFDRDRIFRGYRGLGVWHGAAKAGDQELIAPPALADTPQTDPVRTVLSASPMQDRAATSGEGATVPSDGPAEVKRVPLQTENVVPFPYTAAEPKSPTLNPAERSAFLDLGSRLASRLKSADELARGLIEKADPHENPPYIPPAMIAASQARPEPEPHALPIPVSDDGDDLAAQRPILDALPIGLLIYRGSDFIYANPAFLRFSGHASLTAFAEAGGLDSMFVSFDGAPDDETGRLLRIAPSDRAPAMAGRLVTAPLDGENAMVLLLQPATEHVSTEAAPAELSALLDLATDGVVTFDRDAAIVSANAAAERLFGYDTGALTGRAFGELFAPESERLARLWIGRLAGGEVTAAERNRDLIGRRRQGDLFPLQLTLGRGDSEGKRFHAIFRDMTRWKDVEREMTTARQDAEKASAAKSEFLAKISHEMRTPLNAIIGFSEVMMEERFGPLGNERYRDYLKDIAASGAHLVSLLNDLLDLAKIEAGKMELSPERIDINEITQQSVAIMQAQANRARVIVRTALSMNIPGVIADARSIRQIILNLLSNSIKFTNAGGQVIVSTATDDRGEIILRVRDTGIGMSEKDIEAALQPFRQLTTPSRTDANGTGLGLPLTKALVEANRARFSIKSAVNAGTLVEVVFPAAPGSGQ
ncbi:MAG: histidine kinase dimerization/phospho-acceptor domain-containing protein [Pseudomonadota bacterium]